MNTTHQETWDRYTASWKAVTADEKRAIFDSCLHATCTYTDPLTQTQGWDDLVAYMLDFHRQIPGGHFVTTEFSSHHDRSIAQWNMVNGEGVVLGDGISYGQYDEHGKLVSMTGFFETPPQP